MMMWPTTKKEFQSKYPNLYRWSITDHDLGRFRYSDTDAFNLFIDRVLNGNIVHNYTYKNVGRQHYGLLFLNVSPFFNGSLVKDLRLPSIYFQASNHVYVHPKFIEEVNFQSSAFKWTSTPSFRNFRNENLDFFSKYLDSAAKNPNQFTTGRKISDFFSNIFTGPDKVYVPDALTSALIVDKAYFQAIMRSTKNSPFSHVTLSEFVYLLSSFDNKGIFSTPSSEGNNFNYQDILKLNYLFSTRQFETYSLEDFKLKPARLWYELQFKRYLLHFYEQYYFSYLSPKNKYISLRKNFRIRRRRPYRVFDSNSQNATFFYPSFSFPSKNSFDFEYSTHYPYTDTKSYLSSEGSTFFSRDLTLLKNPSLSANNSFSNLFYTRFSDMYNSAWDFRAQTFTDSHKIYPSFSNSKTKNFRTNFPIDRSLFSDLNFENDDLDRLFINAYFNKHDSSNLIYKTLFSYPEKDLSVAHFYKKFNSDNVDFLPIAFYTNQTSSQFSSFPLFFEDSSITRPGVINNKKYKVFTYYQNLRRFQNPFESINSRPYLRSLFQPSPKYRKFFHYSPKNFNLKNVRPFARRRNSILQDSKTFPAKQSDIYFYFFDPSSSFNKEYSTFYINNTKTFKLIPNSFLDSIYVRRSLPFRIKYKYSDRQKRDYFFNSHIKPRVSLRTPRNKVFPTYRYSHPQKRLKYKQRPPTSYQDNHVKDDLELSDTTLIHYFTEKSIFMFLDIIPELFNTFFVKPLTNGLHIILKSDSFFSVLILSFTFYLLDYAAVIIYIYFPGGLAVFDYTLFNYSFHNAYFSIFILSIFGLLFGTFQIWTLTNLQFSIVKLISLLAFNLFLEIFVLFLIIFAITFTYVSANFTNFIFLFFTILFFFLHITNFFFQFFIQFSRYQYVPNPCFFFPFPYLDQLFGYYKINFFLSNWPKRFSFFFQKFQFYTTIYRQASFQKSFFFIKVGNISTTPYRRLIPNTSYGLYHLSFPIPTYGPNVFEFYSYYYDLISKTSTQKYSIPKDDVELGEYLDDLNVEQENSDYLDHEGELLDTADQLRAQKTEYLHNPINSDENDDWEDTDLDANLIDDHVEIVTKEDFKILGEENLDTGSPSLKDYISYKLVKNNKKFKGKAISTIDTPDLDLADPTQAIFDERLEDLEFDAFDEQFTSESSMGFWYPFQLSRASHRLLPPPVFNLHKRPLDPLFNHFKLVPFLFSIKLYPVKSEKNSDMSEFFSDFSKAFNFYNSFFLSKFFPFRFFSFSLPYLFVSMFFLPIRFFIFLLFTMFRIITFPFEYIFSSNKNQKNLQLSLFFSLILHFFYNPKIFNTKRTYFLYRKQFSYDSRTRSTFKSFLFHLTVFIISKSFLTFSSETNKKRKFFRLIYCFSRFFIYKCFIMLLCNILLFLMRYSRKNSILSLGDSFLRTHHAPATISYMWNFGVYSLFFLAIQIVTGLLLAMYYVPSPEQAFNSVENIMRDVKYGWLLRYMHSNGASFFFIAVYIHIFRGLYYTSFVDKKRTVWYIGAIILLVIIITAFLGYVLPWGQISYWGAIVITNFLSAVPVIGQSLVEWVWGGFSINATTLTRFYGLHFLLPFVILLLSFLHLYYLHQAGHNNPVGTDSRAEPLAFFPYFISKDILGLWIFVSFYLFFVFFYPNTLGHSDNYIPANPLVTPAHIVPEWYFLPLYAILRSIPNKLGGVLLLLFAIISILLLPLLFKTNLTSLANRPLSRHLFFFFLVTCFFLGWVGGQPAQYPYTFVGALATFCYFAYFYIFGPLFIYIENNAPGFNHKILGCLFRFTKFFSVMFSILLILH